MEIQKTKDKPLEIFVMNHQDALHITTSRGRSGVMPCPRGEQRREPAVEKEKKVEMSKEMTVMSQARQQLIGIIC